MPAKKSIEWCKGLAASRGGSCLSAEYINNKTKYSWECSLGHKWTAQATKIQQGQWCPHCSGNIVHDIIWLKELATVKDGQCLSTDYINVHTKYCWRCAKGHEWRATSNSVQQGRWCPHCAGLAPHNLLWLKRLACIKGGECLSVEYTNSLSKYSWRCNEGHVWEATADNINRGHWCPACPTKHSDSELEILSFVKMEYPEAISGQRGLLRNKRFELDIYIPSLRKAIEFDGTYYHKSERAVRQGVAERDARKTRECLDADIDLLRIDEKDWIADNSAVLRKIIAFLSRAR